MKEQQDSNPRQFSEYILPKMSSILFFLIYSEAGDCQASPIPLQLSRW